MQKTIVITGATSGIGRALFLYFLHRGEKVIAVARNKKRLDHLAAEADKRDFKGDYSLVIADFSDLASVREGAQSIIKDHPQGIDVLINNAAIVPKKKHITKDGFEMQYQVNHLAVYLLSYLLTDALSVKKGRIITSSSHAHKRAGFDSADLQALSKYHALRSYARTKLYNVLFTAGYNDRFGQKNGVRAYAVHPGLVKTEIGTKHTSKLYSLAWRLATSRGIDATKAVTSYAYLVYQDKDNLTDLYYYKAKPAGHSPLADDKKNIDILMDATHNQLSDYLE